MKIIIPSSKIYSTDLSLSTSQTKSINLPINDIKLETETKTFEMGSISEFEKVEFPSSDLETAYELHTGYDYSNIDYDGKRIWISRVSTIRYYKSFVFKIKKTENNDSVIASRLRITSTKEATKTTYENISGNIKVDCSPTLTLVSSAQLDTIPTEYKTEQVMGLPKTYIAPKYEFQKDVHSQQENFGDIVVAEIDSEDSQYYNVSVQILYAIGVLSFGTDFLSSSNYGVITKSFDNGTLEEYIATSIEFQLLGECYTLDVENNTVTATSGTEGAEVTLNSNNLIQGKYIESYQSSVNTLLEKYKNGKATATLLCAIGEYYDNDGKKVISTKNAEKMIFEHYDEVVPMYRSPYGFDAPIVLSENNTPKTFLVLGSEIYFDGAVWQKLQLQEFGSVDIKDGTPSLTYEISEDKSYSICTGTTDTQIKDVDIATNFNGFAVKEISNSAFFNTKSIEKVNMPNTLVEIGDLAFSNLSNLSKINFSENLVSIGKSSFTGCGFTDINIPNSTVFIGESAFSSCRKMINLSLGKNIENIGKEAFYFCYYLTKINFNATAMNDLNENDCIFSNAGTSANGIDVFISKNVTQIPSYLFYSKETPNGLFSPPNIVTLQFESDSSCNKIGESAFKDCKNLKGIIIPQSVKDIGYSAFENCTSVEEIQFNAIAMNDFENLDNRVFSNVGKNSNGIKVTIGKDVTRIPDCLFYSVDTYKEGIFPNIVIIEFEEGGVCESIGDKAFADLQKLKSIEFSDSILSFDSVYSLGICPSLESITIPFVGVNKNEINASSHTVFGSLFLPTSHENSTQVTQYYSSNDSTTCYIPSSLNTVKILGGNLLYGAFYNCSMIKNVVIGNGVNMIGERAFYGCTSITSVTIGNSVTSIGSDAFRGCTSLEGGQLHISNIASWCNIDFESVYSNPIWYTECIYLNGNLIKQLVIPNGVEIINTRAFYYCKSLTSVVIPDSVTSIGYNSFGACSNISAVYYMGSEEDWRKITFDSGNSYLTNATRYYYSETEHTDGNYWHYVDGVVTIWGSENSVSTYSRMSAIPTHKHYTTDEGLAVDEYDYNAILYGYKGDKSHLVLPNYINYKQYQIGDYAFAENETIEAISIPYTVTYIGDFAFDNCTNLKDVYYEGTRSQWNNIYIGSGNKALLNANIHFNSFIS